MSRIFESKVEEIIFTSFWFQIHEVGVSFEAEVEAEAELNVA